MKICPDPTAQEVWDDDDHRRGGRADAETWLHQGRDPRVPWTHHFVKTDTLIQKINAAVGLRITVLVGTMWAAYLFAVIAFYSLPSTIKQHSATVLVLWLSSEFLQLVLLPIIIVGQNIQSRAADARAPRPSRTWRTPESKIEHAIDLLDVHTEGGLHDAVAVIIDAINEKSDAGRAGSDSGLQASSSSRVGVVTARATLVAALISRMDGSVAMATAAVAASRPAATEKASA